MLIENSWSWGKQLAWGILLFLAFFFLNLFSYDEPLAFKRIANLVLALVAFSIAWWALSTLKITKQRIHLTRVARVSGILAVIAVLIMLSLEKMPLNIYHVFQSHYFLWDTVAALSAAILEEAICRGLFLSAFMNLETYLEVRKTHTYKLTKAALYSAILFGVLHLGNLLGGSPQAVWQQVFYSLAMGVFLAVLRTYGNNLLWPILLHFILDWAPLESATAPNTDSSWLITLVVFIPIFIFSIIFLIQLDRQRVQVTA
ncbi:CPBP family intramembrane glutamic endopeptidase [Agrilactobacillus fermenti]|uniref:CPBP family intramembrane glutamic endopeptidase n=1 Tax=Agrilactobacillus fermenti TaxID=2586909 RepID=UPI003A5C302C